jgi:hypothetical protein
MASRARCFSSRSASKYIWVVSSLLPAGNRLESTVRYLGIEVNDALEMAEQTDVWRRLNGQGRPASLCADRPRIGHSIPT